MTTRAQNYLNTLSQLDNATASGASLLYVCPMDDEVAAEVITELDASPLSYEVIDGMIHVRLAPGLAVYSPNAPTQIVSKLKLRRAIRSAGLEDQFEAALNANPIIRRDWDDAVEIHADDPLLVDVLPQFAAALGIDALMIKELLAQAAV